MTEQPQGEKESQPIDPSGIVVRCSPQLSGPQRRFLRSRSHHLKPVVMIGDKGVHEALVDQVRAALLAHELIKIKVRGADSAARAETLQTLCAQTGAQAVQIIGRILVLYKAHPEKPSIVLPKGGEGS